MSVWDAINLAYFRYAPAHRDQGGPIARLAARESDRLGEPVFEAFAELANGLLIFQGERSRLYGNCDGSGTAPLRSEAIYRAISEALERWAWNVATHENRAELRFDLDSSTTGFAAYPGLFARSPRASAYMEALERWSLDAWWERKIGQEALGPELPWPGVCGVRLLPPITGGVPVILWKNAGDHRAYGFAAGADTDQAVRKAGVELGRNLHVLEYLSTVAGTPAGIPATRNERRLVYFSTADGRHKFDERLGAHPSASARAPRLVVDCHVTGPWTRYAHVWRCLFDPAGLYDNGADDYFHF